MIYNRNLEKVVIDKEEEWGMCFKIEIANGYCVACFVEGKIKIFDLKTLQLWKQVKFKDLRFDGFNLLGVSKEKLEFIFTVMKEGKKTNLAFKKQFGYFSDSEEINEVSSMVCSTIVQVERLDSWVLMLTHSILYLMEKGENGKNYSIKAFMGLVEDKNLKINPMFETSKEIKVTKKNSKEFKVFSNVFLLSGGFLNLYTLLQEPDGLFYFRLQRSFESVGTNIIYFKVLEDNRVFLANSDNRFFTAFFDLMFSNYTFSVFGKLEKEDSDNLGSVLISKDEDGVIREDYSQSISVQEELDRAYFLTKKLNIIKIMQLPDIINHLESTQNWNLAFSILQKIHRKEEKRFSIPENYSIIKTFEDIVQSYLDFSIGNFIRDAKIWEKCIYTIVYFSQEFNLQNEILLKVKEKSLEYKLIDEYFTCLGNLIQERIVKSICKEEVELVVEYFNLSRKRSVTFPFKIS